MKKFIAFVLSAVLVMGMMAACGGQNSDTGSKQESSANSSAASSDSSSVKEENAATDGKLSEIIDAIYAEKDSGLRVATTEVDLGDVNSLKAYTGLTSATDIKEAAVSEAMIGSQAYSLVLVRVNEKDKLESVAKAMSEGIDQRKWICVEADDMRVVGNNDVVMLIMVSSELSDSVTADQLVSAFENVCGGELAVDVK